MISTLIALLVSSHFSESQGRSQYSLAVVDAFVAVNVATPVGKMLTVQVDTSKEAKLSKKDFASLGELNFITARCYVSEGSRFRNCRISFASVETKNARVSYKKILESIKVTGCKYQRCPDAEGGVVVKLFVPGATGVPTNFCVAPFCVARPSPPPPHPPPPHPDPVS